MTLKNKVRKLKNIYYSVRFIYRNIKKMIINLK